MVRLLRGQPLTVVEVDALDGVARGESAAETGARLFRSTEAVKSQRKKAYAKLGARDRAHAVALAFRAGLIR